MALNQNLQKASKNCETTQGLYMTNKDDKQDYRNVQKSLTELNPDGNPDRDEEGNTVDRTVEQNAGETAEERALRKRIEELRKRDPFIYR